MRTILVIAAIFLPACATTSPTSPSHKVEKDDQEYLVAKSVPAGESDVKIMPPPPEPKKHGDALFNLILLAGAVVAIDALVDDDDEKDENPCKKLPTVWDAKLGSYVVDSKRVKEDDLKKCLEYQEEEEKKKKEKK